MNEGGLAERGRILALLEAYEGLLTEKQKAALDAYYRYDLSLAEIAEEEGISRAGVSDALRHSLEKLEEYERQLGLLGKKERWAARKEELDAAKADAQEYAALLEEIIHGI